MPSLLWTWLLPQLYAAFGERLCRWRHSTTFYYLILLLLHRIPPIVTTFEPAHAFLVLPTTPGALPFAALPGWTFCLPPHHPVVPITGGLPILGLLTLPVFPVGSHHTSPPHYLYISHTHLQFYATPHIPFPLVVATSHATHFVTQLVSLHLHAWLPNLPTSHQCHSVVVDPFPHCPFPNPFCHHRCHSFWWVYCDDKTMPYFPHTFSLLQILVLILDPHMIVYY